jgi:hypothetical protein
MFTQKSSRVDIKHSKVTYYLFERSVGANSQCNYEKKPVVHYSVIIPVDAGIHPQVI